MQQDVTTLWHSSKRLKFRSDTKHLHDDNRYGNGDRHDDNRHDNRHVPIKAGGLFNGLVTLCTSLTRCLLKKLLLIDSASSLPIALLPSVLPSVL